jgi:hypothetical protein
MAVVIRREDGQTRAAAAGKMAGREVQGLCILVTGTGTEHCIFVVDRRSFDAEDRFRNGIWHRTYGDGARVDIRAVDPRNPAPVPIPIGHP